MGSNFGQKRVGQDDSFTKERFATQVQTWLLNRPCWHVNCDRIGSVFELAFGAKVKRPSPLGPEDYSEDFRHFEGESNLLVWCSWRLDGPSGPIMSSDNEVRRHECLSLIVGEFISKIEIDTLSWDMKLHFSNHHVISIFCDHVPPDPSFNGNWDLFTEKMTMWVGPGDRFGIEARSEK